MQLVHSLRKYLPVLIGLLILWAGLFFYSSVLNKANQRINQIVPENANFVFHLNAKEFLKSSTYSLIFNSKDQKLLNALEAYINKSRKGTGKTNDFGIDFMQDMCVFGQNFNGGQLYVMVFSLTQPEVFDKNAFYNMDDNQASFRRNEIGMIATYYGKKKISSQKISEHLSNIQFKSYTIPLERKNFFDMSLRQFKVNDNFHITDGKITSNIDDKALNVKGSFQTNERDYEVSNWTLIPDGFHIENSLISNAVQDSIQKYLYKIGISVGELDRISMNYYGIEVQEAETGILFTPVMDLLLTFKEDYKMQDIFKDTSYLNELGFEKVGNKILAGDITYTLDSLDSKTFFLGNHLNQVVRRKSRGLFEISGDASTLTSIKGGGFIVNFIELLPPFKASKNLFEKIDYIHFEAIPDKNNLVEVQGSLKVKEGAYIYNEFLRFFLTSKGETIIQ